MFDLLVIALLCLVLVKGKRAIATHEHRAQRWRDADAEQRERIVREEVAWRVLGRLTIGAGLAGGAFTVASAGLAAMWALAAWRVVKPIKAELKDAFRYRSAGSADEEPYSW